MVRHKGVCVIYAARLHTTCINTRSVSVLSVDKLRVMGTYSWSSGKFKDRCKKDGLKHKSFLTKYLNSVLLFSTKAHKVWDSPFCIIKGCFSDGVATETFKLLCTHHLSPKVIFGHLSLANSSVTFKLDERCLWEHIHQAVNANVSIPTRVMARTTTKLSATAKPYRCGIGCFSVDTVQEKCNYTLTFTFELMHYFGFETICLDAQSVDRAVVYHHWL